MSEVRIVAESRTEFGKGPARRTRRAGKVPAVLYGHGAQPRHFALPGHELMLALKHDSNVLLTLQTDDGEQLALPKVVVRHPIRRTLEHVDLIAVTKGEKVTVEVPVTLVGAAEPGTLVDQQLNTLSVLADATRLPSHLEVDIQGLAVGGHIEAKDVVLPEGTTLVTDPEHVVVAGLATPTAEELEADLAGEQTEAEAEEAAVEAAADEAPAPRSSPRGRRPLAGRRPGEPGPEVRREPAQRRVLRRRPACRAHGCTLQGAQGPRRRRGGPPRGSAGRPGQALDVHEPLWRTGRQPSRLLQGAHRADRRGAR